MVPGLISSLICQTTSQPQLESFILLSSAVSLKLLGGKTTLKSSEERQFVETRTHADFHTEQCYFGYTADLGCFYEVLMKKKGEGGQPEPPHQTTPTSLKIEFAL